MSNYSDNKNYTKRALYLLFSKYLKLFIFAFLLLIFLISFVFIISPKYTKMKNTANALKEEKGSQIDSLDQYLSRLMAFNRSQNSIRESASNIDSLDKILPEKDNSEDLIIVIDSIIKNRKLSLTSISVGEDTAQGKKQNTRVKTGGPAKDDNIFPEKVKKINFDLSIEGVDYDSMKSLVSDFEKSLRFFDISDINFTDGQSNMTIKLSAYYFQS